MNYSPTSIQYGLRNNWWNWYNVWRIWIWSRKVNWDRAGSSQIPKLRNWLERQLEVESNEMKIWSKIFLLNFMALDSRSGYTASFELDLKSDIWFSLYHWEITLGKVTFVFNLKISSVIGTTSVDSNPGWKWVSFSFSASGINLSRKTCYFHSPIAYYTYATW